MKKRIITKVLAIALIIGGLSISKANANSYPLFGRILFCVDQLVLCEEWCDNNAYSSEIAECKEWCGEMLNECLGF